MKRHFPRVAVLLAAVLAAATCLLAAGPAGGAPPRDVCPFAGCAATTAPDGYVYTYINGILQRLPGTTNIGGQTKTIVPACVGLNCIGPGTFCNLAGQIAAVAAGGGAANAACVAPQGPALNIAAVQAQLTNYLRQKGVPRPTLTVQPNGRTFVNLPTIFYTPTPATFTLPVNEPVAATITAVPHYLWSYGDGTTGPDTAGRPYDPTVPPLTNPGYYLTHDYAKPGAYQATLTVTWQGTFTVAGVAQAFALGAVVLAANAPVNVVEAAGTLTGSGG